jgi:hypothetical protein
MSARRHLWVSVGLLWLIAAGLVRQWPDRSLWYDETVNAYLAESSWPTLWEWCTEIDNQMPLDFALRKLWGGGVGTSEWALRAFSFLCMVLAAAGVIALGRRVSGRSAAGWLAALAFVLSQSFLYAAFEVRPYALALALFAWSSVLLWELWRRYGEQSAPLNRRYGALLVAYLLLALALIYTHYTAFMALAAHGAYLAWRTAARRSQQSFIVSAQLAAGLVIGYLPWLWALAGRDVRAGTAYEARISPRLALKTYAEFYAYGQAVVPPDAPPYAWAAVGMIIAALIIGLGAYRRDLARWRGVLFALIVTAIPLIGLVIMVYGVQAKLSGRHGWMVWIGAALVLGVGLAALERRRWLRWLIWGAALLVVTLPARVETQPTYNSYLREAFTYVDSHAQPGDALILRDGTLFTAAEYYHADLPWIGLPPDKLTDVQRFLFLNEALTRLDTLVESHDTRRVWVIEWQGHIMDPQNLVAGILDFIGEPMPLSDTTGFGDISVSLYTLRQHPDSLRERVAYLQPVVQTPPDGPIYYGGYALNNGPIPRGGIAQIQTWWQRGQTVMPGMRVSVRLYDLNGNFYAQLDQPPVSMSFGQENWPPGRLILSRFVLWIPPNMPPGPVEIKMILYDIQGAFDPITVVVDQLTIAD